jgi:serine protease Do
LQIASDVTALEDIQAAVQDAAARVGPAVAGIGRGWGQGSGVVIAPGRVLTNAHVLRGEELAVSFAGRETVHGRVAGADLDLDLAVVAADTGDTEPVAWDPEIVDAVGIGTPVLALADPGARGLRVTVGFVSSARRAFQRPRGRRVAGAIEHSAPLPLGSSGGPLVDGQGRLVGINTVRLQGGLILALPADAAMRARVDALARGEAGARPRLGVALAPPRASRRMRAAVGLPEHDGLLVRAVQDGSPAAAAGLTRGDLVIAAGGRPVTALDDLLDALEGASGALELTILRGTERRTVAVELG